MLKTPASSLTVASFTALLLSSTALAGGVEESGQKKASAAAAAVQATPQADLRIDWQTGVHRAAVKTRAQLRSALRSMAGTGQANHFVVQFSRPLEPGEKPAVAASGLKLQGYLGNNAYFASARASALEVNRLASLPLVDAQPIQRSWKLHESLERDQVPVWAVVEEKPDAEPVVGAYVLFHPDVDLQGEATVVAQRNEARIRDHVLSLNAMVIELPFDRIKLLAEEDAVQYIEPAMPRMSGVLLNDSNRNRVGANTLHTAPYGLDGTGVSVMVYDAGTALATHNDFSGRATVRDSSGTNGHATHVAGTVAGDGSASSGLYTGMAPGATIESYGFEWDGSGTFLYTNPGDFEADYGDAILNHGTTLANNSIGTNTEPNGFDCSFQGDYGLMSSLIDAVVRGSVSNGAPTRIVWANGNERQGSRCDVEGFGDYYSTAPPATAKNHIAVGALNSNDDSMTSFSSWGPTDDGRLKPDISGPGCEVGDDSGVTSPTSSGTSSYSSLCGTSMASPTVTGILTLLIQDYRNLYGSPDPRNSTLKAMLAQTAVDLGNPGPDYQYGYGSVRGVELIDFMRSGNFDEDTVAQSETKIYTVSVMPGDPELKVTLAWDDAPGTPNTAPSLVNDVDLHVFSPSNVEAFPWTLDPLNPSGNATQVQRDSVNNIEQVYVASPEAGVWRIEVRGNSVPQGPQPYSVTASPNLINCSSQGIVSLSQSSYNCSATSSITVIDCDLNTDDGVIETVSVTVSSTSEPAGETVLLTETGAATAQFEGSIPLGTVDSSGVLLIAEGDTLDAVYVDADDGMGGMSINVSSSAMIDCTPPVISNVLATNITPVSATVQFDVDEPTSGGTNYGTSCGPLPFQAFALASSTSHSMNLSNLTDGTPYSFEVTATDAAGNTTVSNNGGSCFTFSTLDVPDYFTEEFGGDHDLSFRSITFEPDLSFEAYDACSKSVTSFNTNPTGGTALPLSDDDSELVILTGGKTVSLYGVTYDRFYVGSNGYITFGSGDTDYTESLSDHFDLPRISANFDDYNPSSAGTVSWKQQPNRVVVTWLNVPEYNTSNQNSFQVELFFDGRIRIFYRDVASTDGIVGLSGGGGTPAQFIESDHSQYDCVQVNAGPQGF